MGWDAVGKERKEGDVKERREKGSGKESDKESRNRRKKEGGRKREREEEGSAGGGRVGEQDRKENESTAEGKLD